VACSTITETNNQPNAPTEEHATMTQCMLVYKTEPKKTWRNRNVEKIWVEMSEKITNETCGTLLEK
jgi:hypothetical protein